MFNMGFGISLLLGTCMNSAPCTTLSKTTTPPFAMRPLATRNPLSGSPNCIPKLVSARSFLSAVSRVKTAIASPLGSSFVLVLRFETYTRVENLAPRNEVWSSATIGGFGMILESYHGFYVTRVHHVHFCTIYSLVNSDRLIPYKYLFPESHTVILSVLPLVRVLLPRGSFQISELF